MLAEVMVLPTRPSIMSYVRLGAAVSWGGPELLLPSSLEHCDTDILPGTQEKHMVWGGCKVLAPQAWS